MLNKDEAAHVRAEIDRAGAFRNPIHAGLFVCR